MSEEFKCPSCGGTASIAYHRSGDNLLYCQDCQKTFSERYAKIREQAARIAELEAERGRMREALVKLKECLEGYFGKTEKDFFEDCNEDSGELYFADVYNVAVNALKKARSEA